MSKPTSQLLSQVTFSILLALSLQPSHGYGLMQQIKKDSDSKVQIGPGALYSTLKRLNEANIIEEMPFEDEHQRRRYYRLTRKGWMQLTNELAYYQKIAHLAKERRLLS